MSCRRPTADGGKRGCLLDLLAPVWVLLYHSMASKSSDDLDDRTRLSMAVSDLNQCAGRLSDRELELRSRVDALREQALHLKQKGNIPDAKRKLLESRRVSVQLGNVQTNMRLIETQLESIESSQMDRSILTTLKATNQTLKKLGFTGAGLQGIHLASFLYHACTFV
jgi:Snf7